MQTIFVSAGGPFYNLLFIEATTERSMPRSFTPPLEKLRGGGLVIAAN